MNILFFLKPKASVIFLNTDDTIGKALITINNSRFSTYPVIDKNGIYKETVTKGDILNYLFKNNFNPIEKLYNTPLSKIPKKFIFRSIDINNNIEDLLNAAKERENKFIGIILRSEIINYFIKRDS